MFGDIGEAPITSLSGKETMQKALLGFKNLGALRSIIERYMTFETIETVGEEVSIPEKVDIEEPVSMSAEQEAIYEELRIRAEAANDVNNNSPELVATRTEYPNDSTLGLMRKMDKLATDMDLYNGVVTFRFGESSETAIQEALDSIPNEVEVIEEDYDEDGKPKPRKVMVSVTKEITRSADGLTVVIQQEIADSLVDELNKRNVEYTHPVSPKVAKFLDNAKKEYDAGGKQLVFTEEKTQHKKMAKIIATHLGLKLTEIGIINADTVAGKKKGKATIDDEMEGLEMMANAYNTGSYKVMILNKRARSALTCIKALLQYTT